MSAISHLKQAHKLHRCFRGCLQTLLTVLATQIVDYAAQEDVMRIKIECKKEQTVTAYDA